MLGASCPTGCPDTHYSPPQIIWATPAQLQFTQRPITPINLPSRPRQDELVCFLSSSASWAGLSVSVFEHAISWDRSHSGAHGRLPITYACTRSDGHLYQRSPVFLLILNSSCPFGPHFILFNESRNLGSFFDFVRLVRMVSRLSSERAQRWLGHRSIIYFSCILSTSVKALSAYQSSLSCK